MTAPRFVKAGSLRLDEVGFGVYRGVARGFTFEIRLGQESWYWQGSKPARARRPGPRISLQSSSYDSPQQAARALRKVLTLLAPRAPRRSPPRVGGGTE